MKKDLQLRIQRTLYSLNIQKASCSPSFKQEKNDEPDPLSCLRDKGPERFPDNLPNPDGRIVLIAAAVIAFFVAAYFFGAFDPPQHHS